MNSVDILAKLLASENLTVVRTNTRTAFFDINRRILNIPQWKEMTPEIEEMLILHEVGHALFTTSEGYLEPIKENKVISQYANVVEDVRIERKMKERYPGARRSFFIGYKALNDKDFFEVKNVDLSDRLLIDRINLYYKVGYNCGVRFSEKERSFLLRIEKAETEKEVIALATEIYEFSKKELEEKKAKLENNFDDLLIEDEDEYEDDDLFGDGDGDPYEDNLENDQMDADEQKGSSGGNEENLEKELLSTTYEKMKEKLQDLSDVNVVIEYVQPEFYRKMYQKFDVVVGYKTILSEIKTHFERCEVVAKKADTASSNNIVSYLIKEFEMKKSATAYKYAKISKLGQIDAKKLYSYKLRDDIFKQILKTKDSKNHGMIFLLDWSGSMQPYMEEIMNQTISLALFCHRAQIPFQVLAFTDAYRHYSNNREYDNRVVTPNGIGNAHGFNLLELFSNKMSNVEMNQMIHYMSANRSTLPVSLNLGSTPLNDALVFMTRYIGEYIKKNNVEKMSFITLTDGESSELEHSGILRTGYSWDGGVKKQHKVYLRDPITKKEYHIDRWAVTQTEALMKLIKDRYDVTTLGFFVTRNSNRDIQRFCSNNYQDCTLNTSVDMRLGLKSNGYYIIKNMPGRDEYYLLDSKRLNVEDGNFDSLDANSNSRQIAKTFSKVMNTRKTSRVVLNSFIEQVS